MLPAVALSPTNTTLIAYASEVFPESIAKYAVVVLLLFGGMIVGRLLGRLLERVLHELEIDRILHKQGIHFSIKSLISIGASFVVYALTIWFALYYLGVGKFVIMLFAIGAIIIVAISAVLTLKDIVPNIVAGVFLSWKGMVRVGDTLIYGNIKGKVAEMTLIETKVITEKKDVLYIPNALLTTHIIQIRR